MSPLTLEIGLTFSMDYPLDNQAQDLICRSARE